LERVWGQLFDKEGNSTARLGQLLRGIAVHLVCSTSFSFFIAMKWEAAGAMADLALLDRELCAWEYDYNHAGEDAEVL
jgi:hypothetical protein